MAIKRMLLYPIEKWRPVILAFVSLPLLFLGTMGDIEILSALGGLLFILSLLLLFISFIFLLFKKEWSKAFYTLLFMFTLAVIIGLLN